MKNIDTKISSVALIALCILSFIVRFFFKPSPECDGLSIVASGYFTLSINLSLVILNAILLYIIFQFLQEKSEKHLIYPIIYLILNSGVIFSTNVPSVIISDFFILFSLFFLIREYEHKQSRYLVFYISFLSGVLFLLGMSMLHISIIPLLLFLVYLKLDIKSVIILVFGTLLPIYFYILYGYWSGNHYIESLNLRAYNELHAFLDLQNANYQKIFNFKVLLLLILIIIGTSKEWALSYFYSISQTRLSRVIFLTFVYALIFFMINTIQPKNSSINLCTSVFNLSIAYYYGKAILNSPQKISYFLLIMLITMSYFL